MTTENKQLAASTQGLHPFRTGYCDGLFKRECQSPWRNDGFKSIRKNAEYITGFMAGEEARFNGAGMKVRASTCNH